METLNKKKTQKIILSVLAVLLVIFIVIFLSLFNSTGNAVKEQEIIKIGAIQPLTGKVAYAGTWVRQGIDLAVEEINAAGGINGKKLEVIYEDDACNPKDAATAINKLINLNQIKVIIGPTCSSSVLSVAPIAEENKIIVFSTVATSSKITNAGDYIFRNRESDLIHGKVIADFAYKDLEARKAAVLYINLDNGIAFKDSFKQRFTELGAEVVAEESFTLADKDYRAQLTKIKSQNPDALYFAGQRMENAIIQARELGMDQQILGPSTIQNEDLINVAGKHAEGIVYTYVDINTDLQRSQKYLEDYKRKYGKESESYAANSYDAVILLSEIIKKCSEDTTCIKDSLYATQNYNGIVGTFSFDEKGDVEKELTLKTIKNGEFISF